MAKVQNSFKIPKPGTDLPQSGTQFEANLEDKKVQIY